jgi:hypothetical protein
MASVKLGEVPEVRAVMQRLQRDDDYDGVIVIGFAAATDTSKPRLACLLAHSSASCGDGSGIACAV